MTDKQINKQRDRQTERQRDRQTDRHNFLSKTQPLLWKGSTKNRNRNRLQGKCRSWQIVRLTQDGELGNDISSKVWHLAQQLFTVGLSACKEFLCADFPWHLQLQSLCHHCSSVRFLLNLDLLTGHLSFRPLLLGRLRFESILAQFADTHFRPHAVRVLFLAWGDNHFSDLGKMASKSYCVGRRLQFRAAALTFPLQVAPTAL